MSCPSQPVAACQGDTYECVCSDGSRRPLAASAACLTSDRTAALPPGYRRPRAWLCPGTESRVPPAASAPGLPGGGQVCREEDGEGGGCVGGKEDGEGGGWVGGQVARDVGR